MIDSSVRGLLGAEWNNGTNSGVDRCFVLAFAHLKNGNNNICYAG